METLTKTTWAIDPTHSQVNFKVKHLVISTVTGKFEEYYGVIESKGEDFEQASITFQAKTNSINTGVPDRDAHLKSDDFFNSDKFPELKFKSTSWEKVKDGQHKLIGDLTIRDVTQTIELKAEYGGTVQDPYGNTKAGFEISGTLNRKAFGLKWDAVTEAGSVVVSDEVKLQLDIQIVKQ